MYQRSIYEKIDRRIKSEQNLIQVLLGPRQVGKTTLALDLLKNFDGKNKVFVSADDPTLSSLQNLNEIWQQISKKIEIENTHGLLIIDEIHKYPDWEKVVKARWDEIKKNKTKLKVIILGSAPLLIQKGLSESLAGRFEVIEVTHWSYTEIKSAFSCTLEEYIYFGSYPGAMPFIYEEDRWKSYLKNSLIETTISRDIMLLTRIDKPALLRQLFYISCQYSGQVVSYQKMVGQLQDAGNTTTLAHYLDLLSAVGFIKGLQKFTGSKIKTRSSSPKLQVYNTALLSALSHETFQETKQASDKWGRWVESAVGAHLLNKSIGTDYQIMYWKDGPYEVDFILTKGKKTVAIEVKSGRKKESLSGLLQFKKQYAPEQIHIVGDQGIKLEDFLKKDLQELF
jgi:uncharacterized protein